MLLIIARNILIGTILCILVLWLYWFFSGFSKEYLTILEQRKENEKKIENYIEKLVKQGLFEWVDRRKRKLRFTEKSMKNIKKGGKDEVNGYGGRNKYS